MGPRDSRTTGQGLLAMRSIAEWLTRLHDLTPAASKEVLARLTVPGANGIHLTNAILGLEPLHQPPRRPGETHPTTIVLLRYLDEKPKATNLPASFSITTDLAALLTLAANRRIEAAPEFTVGIDGHPGTYFLGYATLADRMLHSPPSEQTTTTFLGYLSRIPSLDPRTLETLSAATHLHYGSANLAHTDIRSAYVLAVAGIEVLSRAFSTPDTTWDAWDGAARWNQLFTETHLTPEDQERVRHLLLADKQLQLKHTFCTYAAQQLPDTFWEDTWEEATYSIELPAGTLNPTPHIRTFRISDLIPHDRQLLTNDLKRTYDLRSGIVHRGHDLDLFETALRPGLERRSPAPLPYALLRTVLARLIQTELLTRGQPTPLPNIIFRTKQ
jgi:hypothetical protein